MASGGKIKEKGTLIRPVNRLALCDRKSRKCQCRRGKQTFVTQNYKRILLGKRPKFSFKKENVNNAGPETIFCLREHKTEEFRKSTLKKHFAKKAQNSAFNTKNETGQGQRNLENLQTVQFTFVWFGKEKQIFPSHSLGSATANRSVRRWSEFKWCIFLGECQKEGRKWRRTS